MWVGCSLFPKPSGTHLEAPSPLPEQHSGLPPPKPSREEVVEIAGKQWSLDLARFSSCLS